MKRIKSKFSFMKGSKYSFGYILILFLMVLTPMYAQTSRKYLDKLLMNWVRLLLVPM